MCQVSPFTYPIKGERLERLKARDEDGGLGHPDEWGQLIRQENSALTRFIQRKLGQRRNSEKLTEDALTETWLAAMRKIAPSYERSDLKRGYLFFLAWGAVKQVTRDGERFDHGHGASDAELDVLNWLEARDFTDEPSLLNEFETLLDRAVPQLSERDRTVVRMYFAHGHTFAEIATTLKLALSTVTSSYYRALGKLLDGLGDDPSKWL